MEVSLTRHNKSSQKREVPDAWNEGEIYYFSLFATEYCVKNGTELIKKPYHD